jgi:hypothetical protein
VARESATEQHVEPSLGESSRSENNTLGDTAAAHAGAASEPAPPIDWRTEIETSTHALKQHDGIESGRHSLAGPKQQALSASPQDTCVSVREMRARLGNQLRGLRVAALQGRSD